MFGLGLLTGPSCGGQCSAHGYYDCAFGSVGGQCDRDADCVTGFCCERDDCDRGMCTYECDRDGDCPPDMRCEHDMCFFACNDDRDCAPGWECEHGNTVCEYD